jgi:competence protein ComEC
MYKDRILSGQSNRPMVPVALSFALGIVLSNLCRQYSFCSLLIAAAAFVCASFSALRKKRLFSSFLLGNAAILMAGLLTSLAHRDGIPDFALRSLLCHSGFRLDEPVLFEGCVDEESERRGEENVTTIDLHGFLRDERWIACEGKGLLRTALPEGGAAPSAGAFLNMGDRVRGWATWRIPRNYQNPGSADRSGALARNGIFLIGRAKSPRLLESIPGDCSNLLTAAVNSVRGRVRRNLKSMEMRGKGKAAAVLASLVIGDYSALDNQTREAFQNSGTFHVLVVSGLHVAWIAGVLLHLLRLIRIPERIRYFSAILAVFLYASIVGFQASITRCLWMFFLYLAGRMIIRCTDPVNILCTSALILLLFRPDWLFEIGFQLSFLSVLAIAMTASPAIDKYLRPLLQPLRHAGDTDRLYLETGFWHRCGRAWRTRCELSVEAVTDRATFLPSQVILRVLRNLAGAALAMGGVLMVSFSVQIWLEPLLAYHFNRMSWISPLANLAIVPFSSLVLATGILSSLLMNVPFLGNACASIAERLAVLLLFCTDRITTFPGAWQRCPTAAGYWIAGGLLILFTWSCLNLKRFWIPCSYILILLSVLSAGWNPESAGKKCPPRLRITFLDVGEGDASIISFPNGQNWVVDAGWFRQAPSWDESTYGLDLGEAVVSPYLWDRWITHLDRLILTHTDLDHAGGIPALLKNFRVDRFGYSQAGNDPVLAKILKLSREKTVAAEPLFRGMEESIGEVKVRVLHPPLGLPPVSDNRNSVVLAISYKHFSALLTGDLDKEGERDLLARCRYLRHWVLKVAHHGSRTATADDFLERTNPRWAVISVGRNNPFGHPSPEVFTRILKHGARPLLTPDQGAVTFETDGFRYTLSTYISGMVSSGDLGQFVPGDQFPVDSK